MGGTELDIPLEIMTRHASAARPRRQPSWWPLAVILVLAAVIVGAAWGIGDREGQQRVMVTFTVLLVAGITALAWLVFLSPLSARGRVAALAIAAVVIGGMASLTRVRGVTGDFVPILEWRWAAEQPLAGPAPATVPDEPYQEPLAADTAVPPRAESLIPAPGELSIPEAGTPAAAERVPAPAVAPAADAAPSPLLAASFPQFLGPSRNGVITGVRLATDWSTRAPRPVWRQRVGPGWSGFAVQDGLAITQEQRGAEEALVAYDLATGAVRWVHGYPARYATVVAGEGPRATPAVAGDRVVAHGATGMLTAVDRRTGRRAWQRDLPREHQAPEPEWGRSSSPLVVDDRVIVNAGGPGGRSLVAHALATGELAWAGGGDRVGYASPVLVTLAGVPQVVAFNIASVTAHDPETGAVLWEHPWPGRQPNVSQPLPVGDDRLLVSSGYGVGSALLRIARDDSGALAPTVLWESPRLKAKFTNVVLHDGFVYGLDDGVLVCLDLETGERRWKSGRYGHGQVLLVEGLLLVQTEEGEVVLVDPQPERHVEVARFQALDGKTWNPPALAGRYLLVRNDREAAMYELPTR
jgi:outer membrane protein assembly factor BamB